MCERTGIPPLIACTVGDLIPGYEYHDSNGETWMVTTRSTEDSTTVVNVGNGPYNTFGNAMKGNELKGTLTEVYNSLRLGYDDRGRLYASTALNGWYYEPTAATPEEERGSLVAAVAAGKLSEEEPEPVYDDDDAFPVDTGIVEEGVNLGTGEVGPASNPVVDEIMSKLGYDPPNTQTDGQAV